MTDFLVFFVIGFVAQAVDGALGMAFGVISTTALLSFGVSPAHASAAVHAAEVFTTGASAASHARFRNIDWALFWRLAPFGVAGGVLGAYVLTGFDGKGIRPLVTAYLALIGLWILARSFRKLPARPVRRRVAMPLAAVGGFLDAIGGGGWGPVVTTGLLGSGGAPRYVVGTVNAVEFLLTVSVSTAFLVALVTGHWENATGFGPLATATAGLVAGGLLAAPLAGFLTAHLSETTLLRLVGILITAIAAWQTWSYVPA